MLARHVEEDGGLRIPEGGGGKVSRPWQGKVSWPDFIPSPREDQAWRSHLLLALTIISPTHDGDRLFLGFAVLAPTCT